MPSVDDALTDLDPVARDALGHLVALARAVVPDAVDGVSYGLPALLVDGKPLIGFGASARHLSLVPYSPTALDTVRAELTGFDVSKGLIRFTSDRPVPDEPITRLLAARLAEIRPGSVVQPGR